MAFKNAPHLAEVGARVQRKSSMKLDQFASSTYLGPTRSPLPSHPIELIAFFIAIIAKIASRLATVLGNARTANRRHSYVNDTPCPNPILRCHSTFPVRYYEELAVVPLGSAGCFMLLNPSPSAYRLSVFVILRLRRRLCSAACFKRWFGAKSWIQ